MEFNQDGPSDKHPWESFQRAPHKPCLMLAICRGFSTGRITNGIIIPEFELESDFQNLSKIVDGKKREFRLPFFHLRTEGYWVLKREDGMSSVNDKIPKSMKGIRETYSAAEIPDSFLSRLTNPSLREQMIQSILTVNFHPSIHLRIRQFL